MIEQNRFGTVIPSTDQPTAPGYAPPLSAAGCAAPPPPPGYAYPAAGPRYGTSSTGRSRGRRSTVIAAGVVGGLVAVLVLAAGAKTIVDNREANAAAARTTISFPASVPTDVADLTLVSSDIGRVVQAQMADVPRGFGTPKVAVYGTAGTPTAVVIAGVHPMTPGGQRDFMKGLQRGLAKQGLAWWSFAPGALGGHLLCGSLPGTAKTICGFTDGGSYGAIVVSTVGPPAVSMVLGIRSAVERRS